MSTCVYSLWTCKTIILGYFYTCKISITKASIYFKSIIAGG